VELGERVGELERDALILGDGSPERSALLRVGGREDLQVVDEAAAGLGERVGDPTGAGRRTVRYVARPPEGPLALEALTALVSALEVDRARLAKAASDPLLFATDAAEALVARGMPFRDAHEEVAARVREGTFRRPRNVAHRPAPGPGGIADALAEARSRFVDNL